MPAANVASDPRELKVAARRQRIPQASVLQLRFDTMSSTKTRLCDVPAAAKEKLPEHTGDKSGIGVHFVDAFIKPMNVQLADGTRVRCKRRGLKITLTVGDKKGEGLLRRLEVSRDPVLMLNAALQEAAKAAGVELSIDDGAVYIAF
jgi:hypothetical protein